MSEHDTATQTEPPPPERPTEPTAGFTQRFLRGILSGSALVTFLAIVLALLAGALLVIVSNEEVQDAATYFFSRPADTFVAAWDVVTEAYSALFTGAVVDFGADTFRGFIRPFTETVLNATPLIAAGLAVALPFRAGLFNIGAEGQIILGATAAGYVGFAWDLPVGIHLLVGIMVGVAAAALWGGIPGFLKARTGAHEVITTIMLNYIARFLLAFLLTTEVFRRPGRTDPISPVVSEDARLPLLFGFRAHSGILLALLAAAFVWWLLNRSTLGFKFRAVGANPAAARTAGISVNRSFFGVMLIAGGLSGVAGVSLVLGTERTLTGGISGGYGFDAITVALLGRGSPIGTVFAGLLFGALRAGGIAMQARTGTPIDLVLVIQSLIVLFIAAPPLVRAVFRIRAEGAGLGQLSKGWSA